MVRGAFLILITGLAGCQAGLQVPQALSIEAESLAGRRAAPALEQRFGGVEHDAAAEARLAELGGRLSRCLPAESRCWHYAVLKSDQINAFSLPGGLIYVTRGLYERIKDDDGLLAAGLAHEMSHVLRQDSLKPACHTTEESLAREIDADSGAVALLRAAGLPTEPLDRLLAMTADVQPRGWSEDRRSHLPLGRTVAFGSTGGVH